MIPSMTKSGVLVGAYDMCTMLVVQLITADFYKITYIDQSAQAYGKCQNIDPHTIAISVYAYFIDFGLLP